MHIIRRRLARPAGLEPATRGLEGRCSIRLSYGRNSEWRPGEALYWSGQRDLNPRHPAPKAGALPDCAMPRSPDRMIIRTTPVTINSRSPTGPGRPSSASRVMPGVHDLETLARDMRVYLSRGNVAVTKQHLNHPQIGAMIEEVGRERMAQRVR